MRQRQERERERERDRDRRERERERERALTRPVVIKMTLPYHALIRFLLCDVIPEHT